MALQSGVLYLQKDRFQIYVPNIRAIIEFRFTPDMIRDLDVLNQDILENYIKTFVINSKIAPCNLIIVLSNNVSFIKDIVAQNPVNTPPQHPTKDIPKLSPEALQQQVDLFLEHVPYDYVVSLLFPIPNGKRVYATNKELFEAVRTGFEKLGFTTEGVYPGLLIGNLGSRPVMDAAMVNLVLQKASSFKQFNLMGLSVYQPREKSESEEDETSEEPDILDEVKNTTSPKKSNTKRLILLIGVFISLIAVLVVVYYVSNSPSTPTPKNADSDANTQQVAIVTQTVLSSVSASLSAEPSIGALSVQITNTKSSSQEATALENQLGTYGFKFINENDQLYFHTNKTLIAFSQNVFPDVRNTVINEVKKISPNITVETNKAPYDISIILSN